MPEKTAGQRRGLQTILLLVSWALIILVYISEGLVLDALSMDTQYAQPRQTFILNNHILIFIVQVLVSMLMFSRVITNFDKTLDTGEVAARTLEQQQVNFVKFNQKGLIVYLIAYTLGITGVLQLGRLGHIPAVVSQPTTTGAVHV
jgi:hypothetical protein